MRGDGYRTACVMSWSGSVLPEEWLPVTLGEVVEINPLRIGVRGIGAPFLAMTDVIEGARNPRQWTSRAFTSTGSKFCDGDTLLARITPCLETGKTCLVSGLGPGVVGHGSTEFIILASRDDVTDPTFVYYLARSPLFRSYAIRKMEGSTGRQRVPVDAVARFSVRLPPLREQRAIAEVLGALEDKIDCNSSIAVLAEGLAVSLFADAVNRIDNHQSKVCRLSDLVDHLPGKYLQRERYREGGAYTVHGSNSVMGCHSEYLYKGPFTVMARIGSNCGALTWSQDSAWVNNNASALRAKPGIDPWFLHRLLQTIDMDRHRAGTGQPFVRVASLLSAFVTVPDARHRSLIGSKLCALAELSDTADVESKKLGSVRDALLPPLLSGELRVRGAELLGVRGCEGVCR
jgi:hypothetical protein